MALESPLSLETIFSDVPLSWGKKYPNEKLFEIWKKDKGYLLWACGLDNKKNNIEFSPPSIVRTLVYIAFEFSKGNLIEAESIFNKFQLWRDLSQEGKGLNQLPRPSTAQCQSILSSCTLLGGHADLDGIYSLAAAIYLGGALGGIQHKIPFNKLRLFRYSFRNLTDYTESLAASKDDICVIIDFSAHPQAQLNLDHHTTSLSFWDYDTECPQGIFDPTMPSCPRLLSSYCGLQINEEILQSCDMVDGALYSKIEQTSDLNNPFIALEYALGVDTSDTILKKVVIDLATNQLDPYCILNTPIWQTRIKLVSHALEEQRSYWSKDKRFKTDHPLCAVADARLTPYPASRFRYLPFENDQVRQKPYLITLRSSARVSKVNLGISRNPFYQPKSFFDTHNINLGAIARSLGQGGGRQEVSSLTVNLNSVPVTLETILFLLEKNLEN